jgi:group I intron endonuclease
MVNYENGQIYALRNYVNDLVYIGATTVGLSARMAEHRKRWKNEKSCNRKIYQAFSEIGVENFYITQIEACPCKNLNELLAREGFYIRLFDTVNNGYNGSYPCGLYVGLSEKERERLRGKIDVNYRERKQRWKESHREYHREYMREYKVRREAMRQAAVGSRADVLDSVPILCVSREAS